MVERKKIAGGGRETGAGTQGIEKEGRGGAFPPPQSPAPVLPGSLFIAALFSSFPPSESLEQAR